MVKENNSIIDQLMHHASIIDLYGEDIKYSIKGRETSKSVIGSLNTLLIVFLCLYLPKQFFIDWYSEINPTISLGQEFGPDSITINQTNPFISLGFYAPKGDSKIYANSTTDYGKINSLSSVVAACTDCSINDQSIKNFLVGSCDKKNISEIKLSSYSSRSSKNITDIFQTYSFCFPQNFSATLKDDDITVTNFISSLSLYIPDTYNPNGTTTSNSSKLKF